MDWFADAKIHVFIKLGAENVLKLIKLGAENTSKLIKLGAERVLKLIKLGAESEVTPHLFVPLTLRVEGTHVRK